jgi:hypothetical protein
MKILFICGSLNQTTMMHQIAAELNDHECFFTTYYADGVVNLMAKSGLLKSTILGGRHRRDSLKYLTEHQLPLDIRGIRHEYDLVVTGSDSIIQKNIRSQRIVLVQEGMTEPEGIAFHLVRALKLPRWMANTSVMGLSNAFDAFCVASYGYKELFTRKGVRPEKLIVTGIPNFDNLDNIKPGKFKYRDYVLVATTPFRETMRPEIRPLFILKCVEIAHGRQLIFKLHPMENVRRAVREIRTYAPGAKVFWRGNINPMILNAETVITQWSSCTFVAMALGKEVYSDLDSQELRKLMPIQNRGTSAVKIAQVCRMVMNTPMPLILQRRQAKQRGSLWDQFEL